MEQSPLGDIVRAKKCPHYITLRFVAQTGQSEMCRKCIIHPVVPSGVRKAS